MKYKSYNCNSYNIHTIKTDKFKTCFLEIIFRKKADKKDFAAYNLLADILTESTMKYPTKKEMILHLEDLYQAIFYGINAKSGNGFSTNFIYEFISPSYIDEKGYLESVLSFPFESLLNPYIINDEFDNKLFEERKKRLVTDIKSVSENGMRLSIHNALKKMNPNSISSFRNIGELEDLEYITPSSLYKTYKSLFKDNLCDIFLVGDIDMDMAVEIIKKAFKHRIINNNKLTLNYENNTRKKELIVIEDSQFLQANIVMIYNLVNLTYYEKDIVLHVYNYIMGSGGLNSKLYQEIREKKSYCYSIEEIIMKYDNLFIIHVALDNKNITDTIKTIKKLINNSSSKLITEEDLSMAKMNLTSSLLLNMDSAVSLINNYAFNVFANLPLLEDRIKLINNVTLEEVINLAKKLKINTTYVLKGDNNGEN